jgi:sugar O-acyltransferase (sialic acid O-acetyltransferase NeuD family)
MVSSEFPLLVLGTTAFSTEVADVARTAGWKVAGFVENLDQTRCREPLDGVPVHWVDDLSRLSADHVVVCGLGTTYRSRFTREAEQLGARFATVIHPSAIVSPTCVIGDGSVVGAAVVIGAHTRLGRHVLVNRGALIGHHDEILDHTSILPGANIAGACVLGPAAYVGMGAVVIDHRRVGAHAVLGAGAVVVDDVPEHVLVFGAPARIIKTGVDGK